MRKVPSTMKTMSRRSGSGMAVGILCACMVFSGCAASVGRIEPEDGKITVAVSIVPQKAFVDAVCGDKANVVVLIPPGNSPENHEPSPREMEDLEKADIYFTIGVAAENTAILPRIGESGQLPVVRLQDAAAKAYPDLEMAPGQRDPHIWLSPKRVKTMVETIALELGRLDPANKALYADNADLFEQELDSLDARLKKELHDKTHKAFFTFHPAFGYLAEDYGLVMMSLQEDGKEATPQHLKELIDTARKEDIHVIFHQAEIDSKQSLSFAEEIDGTAVLLDPLSGDYVNNMTLMVQTLAEAMK